jgi:hypothetical protein
MWPASQTPPIQRHRLSTDSINTRHLLYSNISKADLPDGEVTIKVSAKQLASSRSTTFEQLRTTQEQAAHQLLYGLSSSDKPHLRVIHKQVSSSAAIELRNRSTL